MYHLRSVVKCATGMGGAESTGGGARIMFMAGMLRCDMGQVCATCVQWLDVLQGWGA